jgi:hypothetical protein
MFALLFSLYGVLFSTHELVLMSVYTDICPKSLTEIMQERF